MRVVIDDGHERVTCSLDEFVRDNTLTLGEVSSLVNGRRVYFGGGAAAEYTVWTQRPGLYTAHQADGTGCACGHRTAASTRACDRWPRVAYITHRGRVLR